MTNFKFYTWLFLTSLTSLIISVIISYGRESEEINKATYLLICFFIFFTIAIFIFSNRTISSSNPYLFTRVFMVSISFKILFLTMLVISCIKFLHIKPRDLVGPLLSSYLLFTILETWVLMKLSKTH